MRIIFILGALWFVGGIYAQGKCDILDMKIYTQPDDYARALLGKCPAPGKYTTE